MKRFIPFIILLSLSSTILGNVINVPANYTTIQQAIEDAFDGDEIVIAEGVYYENIDFLGKSIILRSTDPNDPKVVDNTVIDGGQNSSVVTFDNGENANTVLSGLTIAYGYAANGGGIYCSNGSEPMIIKCIVRDNSATYGGGIYNSMSKPKLTNCTFSGNSADMKGGGMYNSDSEVEINGCTFSSNTNFGHGRGGGEGGGIYNYNNELMQIANSVFTGNIVKNGKGGGIYTAGELNSTIYNCSFTGNAAQDSGNGLYNDSNSTLTDCIFWNNKPSGSPEECEIYIETGSELEINYSDIKGGQSGLCGSAIWGAGNINADPCFVEPGYWDASGTPDDYEDDFWVDGDYHLKGVSPCVNSGDPCFAGVGMVDIDGDIRVIDGRVDMGADEEVPGQITVMKPKGGNVWTAGSIHFIEWLSIDILCGVDLCFSDNNGLDWTIIAQDVGNTGSYMWSVPDIVDSAECVVKVLPHFPGGNETITSSGLFAIQPDSPGLDVGSKWRTLGGGFDRSGLNVDYGPEIGCVQWKFETDGLVSAGVTVGENCIHIASEDGNVYTVDANGSLLWSYDTNSPILCSPTIGEDGSVYVGDLDNRLFAIDKNGGIRWTFDTDGFIYSSPAVSEDGNVYVCSEAGTLYALAPDGTELWTFQTGGISKYLSGAIMASPAVDANNTVYIPGVYDSNLYALDGSDGSVKWHYHFDSKGWVFASPVIDVNRNVIYQTLLNDANLYAIDANNGGLLWKTDVSDTDSNWFEPYYTEPELYNVTEDSYSEPVLGPGGTIYVSMDDPYLRAVEPNGTIKWIEKFGELGGFTMTVGGDGLVYAASDDGELYVINPQGQPVARFEGDEFLSFPVISDDNTLLINDANNAVWAVGTDGCEDKPLNPHRLQDLNGDGSADFYDFGILANEWQSSPNIVQFGGPHSLYYYFKGDQLYLSGDVNGDLFVDLYDLAILAERWLTNN